MAGTYGSLSRNRDVAAAASDARSPGGKSTGSTGGGAGTAALTAPAINPQAQVNRQFQTEPQTVSQPGSVPISGGKGLTDDSGIITHKQFSPGQLESALGMAVGLGMGGPTAVAGTLASAATADPYGRTLEGAAIDKAGGFMPDKGYTGPNHIANNTNARGDVRQAGDDTNLADRAGGAATAALLGDAPSTGAGTDALFSDVTLADKRKPRSDLAGTAMLLKAA